MYAKFTTCTENREIMANSERKAVAICFNSAQGSGFPTSAWQHCPPADVGQEPNSPMVVNTNLWICQEERDARVLHRGATLISVSFRWIIAAAL